MGKGDREAAGGLVLGRPEMSPDRVPLDVGGYEGRQVGKTQVRYIREMQHGPESTVELWEQSHGVAHPG